jgi:hypothetical protein
MCCEVGHECGCNYFCGMCNAPIVNPIVDNPELMVLLCSKCSSNKNNINMY